MTSGIAQNGFAPIQHDENYENRSSNNNRRVAIDYHRQRNTLLAHDTISTATDSLEDGPRRREPLN